MNNAAAEGFVRLGVNIDHAATLRQVRGTLYPDLVEVARQCESGGARGITVHLREDRRHIQDRDVYALRKALTVRMNLEMANSPEIVRIALDVHPDEVCLVPERRMELTTEGGLDVVAHRKALAPTIAALRQAGIDVSLFVDAESEQLKAAAELGVPYVELHTGSYCDALGVSAEMELDKLIAGARLARRLGLKVNAGHGINLQTIGGILRMPHLDTLNIGHSIVCRALIVGMRVAVEEMGAAMRAYDEGEP